MSASFFFLFKLGTLFLVSAYAHPSSPDKRIVNGYEADIYNHPYLVQVAPFLSVTKENDVIETFVDERPCSGTILNIRWVITAARCFDHCLKTKCSATLRGGTTLWNRGAPVYYSEEIIVKEHSVRNNSIYDLALVKADTGLMTGYEYTDSIRLAEQPIAGYRYHLVTIPGWGDTCGASPANHLRAVDLLIMNKDQCRTELAQNGITLELDETLFCIKSFLHKNAAKGDYGDPAIVEGHLMGVVTQSLGCTLPDAPIILINTTFYKSWIENTIRLDTFSSDTID